MPPRTLRIALVVLAALLVGKAVLFVAAGQPPLFRDALGYWQLGAEMAHGDWLLLDNPQVFRTPGYPAFLAVCMLLFGNWALLLATVAQQMAIVVTALLTAWICWRITGSRAAAAVALALSLLCIARSYIGLYLLSDTLTCLLLTAFWAGFVAWFQRPSLGSAAAMGLLLGLGVITRPVMQLVWIPVLLAMWLYLRKQNAGRNIVKHAFCLLFVAALPVVPWLARNVYCFDRPFLTRAVGRQLWDSCFLGEPSDRWLNPTLDFVRDAPTTARVFDELQGRGVSFHDYSSVCQGLSALGYTESEMDDLMAGVSREAIQSQWAKFAVSRSYRCLVFWITSEETLHWRYDNIERDDSGQVIGGEVATGFALGDREPRATYKGQATWCCPPVADATDAFVRCIWHPSRFLYALAAAATWWGAIGMIRDPRQRGVGVALALLLLYFTAVTAIPARPMYRYRAILEPLMIVAATTGLWLAGDRRASR